MSMASRQRVVAAIEHREPDRVPIDFNPVPDFYVKLKEHLGLEIDEQLKVGFMEEAIPHPKVLDALGADMISVKLGSSKSAKPPSTGSETVTDSWGVGLKRVFQGSGSYLEPVHHPLAEADIDDPIDIGMQILDPVQPLASGMDSAELKAEFGNRLTFHGGVDEQHVLPFGTVEDVEAEVRLRLAAFGPGGGYILAPSHYVQADTSPENIVAMCRAAREFGRYPIDAARLTHRSA